MPRASSFVTANNAVPVASTSASKLLALALLNKALILEGFFYGVAVKTVPLDGKPVQYDVVDTTRGREVRVETNTDQRHTLVVTTG